MYLRVRYNYYLWKWICMHHFLYIFIINIHNKILFGLSQHAVFIDKQSETVTSFDTQLIHFYFVHFFIYFDKTIAECRTAESSSG